MEQLVQHGSGSPDKGGVEPFTRTAGVAISTSVCYCECREHWKGLRLLYRRKRDGGKFTAEGEKNGPPVSPKRSISHAQNEECWVKNPSRLLSLPSSFRLLLSTTILPL